MNPTIRWAGLALIVATVAAVWWLLSDSADPLPTQGSAVRAAAQTAEPTPSEVEADRSLLVDRETDVSPLQVMSPEVASAASGDSAVWQAASALERPRPAQTIEWEIQQMAGQKEMRSRVRNALKELAAHDTEESRGILLSLLEDLELRFPGKEEGIARALRKSDDPRIVPAVLRTSQALVERGDTNRLRPVLQLVAIHGGSEGADYVVSLLQDTNAALHGIAASLITDLDRSCGPALGAIARSDAAIANQVRFGLVQWSDVAGRRELLSIAQDESVATTTREACIRGLAQSAPAELLPEVCISFWNDGGPQNRRLALDAVSAMERNEELDAITRESLTMPILSDAIIDPDPELRWRAFELLDRAPFPLSVRLPLIQTALSLESDPKLLQQLAQWLEDHASG